MSRTADWSIRYDGLGLETLPGRGEPIVFLHGFTQTARSWRPVVQHLRTERPIACVDAPGHGASASVHLDPSETADAVSRLVPRSTLVGYSMGGRIALHVALQHPESVERLVLIGATPGIEDDAERAARRDADAALADRLERIGLDAFLDEWLAQPLFATLTDEQRNLDDRRRNTIGGLAASLRSSGTGQQESLWPRLDSIRVPTLVIAGEHDTKFTSIGRRMVGAIGPSAELHVAAGRGHAVHLEDPRGVASLIDDFVSD